MSRSAARTGGGLGAVALALSLLGCAATTAGLDQLPTAEQDLFRRCREPIGAQVCGGRDEGNRAACLDAQATVFAARSTNRMRRRWLEVNGCPAELLDQAPSPPSEPAPEALASAQPAAPPAQPAEPPAQPAEPSPIPEPPAAGPTSVSGACRRSADCQSDLCVRGTCVTLSSLLDGPPARCPTDDKAAEVAPPTPAPTRGQQEPGVLWPFRPINGERHAQPEAPSTPRPTLAGPDTRLRETIVAHEAEMKTCVDRQLKLVPTFRAEGTLVIEVDSGGRVTQADLRGERLQGSPLEGCLRTVARRWQFPSTTRAYAVEAPIKVLGVENGRP